MGWHTGFLHWEEFGVETKTIDSRLICYKSGWAGIILIMTRKALGFGLGCRGFFEPFSIDFQ